MEVLEQKEVTINNNYYVITAMPADNGMEFLDTMMRVNGGNVPVKEMKALIVKYVKLGGKAFTEKSYGTHFSRNYSELTELFEEVLDFNFGGMLPNDSSDTSQDSQNQEDTLES